MGCPRLPLEKLLQKWPAFFWKMAYPSDLAWARVASRAARGGHSVPYEDVIRRFVRSLENLPKAIALADKATILDNSTQGYRLIQVAK